LYKTDFIRYDFGLIIGGNIDLAVSFLGQGKLTIDFRYNLGLLSIGLEEEGEKYIETKVVSIMVGYNL